MNITPDETVAEQIVAELGEQQLVAASKLPSLGKKLAAGTMTAEDWRRWAEQELDRPEEIQDANADTH